MPSWRPFAAAHPWCPFSGAIRVRGSHQSQAAAQLPFGRLHSNLAPVSFAPGVGSPIHRYVAAANATPSTLSPLLSPGGFALRCILTAVATSCPRAGTGWRNPIIERNEKNFDRHNYKKQSPTKPSYSNERNNLLATYDSAVIKRGRARVHSHLFHLLVAQSLQFWR